MEIISVREVLRKATSRIGDSEDSIWGELNSAMSGLTKLFLETLAESEVERRIGARLYERGETRSDQRNGYRSRKAQLSYTAVEIRIPRLRGQGYVPSYLQPNHRAIAVVEGWVEKAFMAGLSRSEVIRLMESTTGCNPSDLELIVSDEHNGLLNAASEVLGDVPHQLCWAHRCRNVRKAVAPVDRKAVIAGLKDVYDAEHLVSAKDAFRRWSVRWGERYPGVVHSVTEDMGYLLAFYRSPKLHWEYLRTSNPIERVFRELRRQQYGSGAFANREACNRAVFRVFNWLNEIWKGKDIWQPRARKHKTIAKAA